jgi:hypothetical protein
MPVDSPRRVISPAFLVSILTLVIATSGAAFAVGKGSVTSADIANNAVLSRHIKNGQIQAVDLAKGAASLTSVSFAMSATSSSVPTTDKVVVSLTDTGAGGKVTVARASRLLVHGSVTIGNGAGTGQFSMIECRAQANSGTGWADLGPAFGTESVGNSNHDERYNVAIEVGSKIAKGSYNVRLVCVDTDVSASSQPIVRSAGLTVTAVTP